MRIALLPGGGSHFGGFGRPRGRGKGGGDGKPARSVDGRSSVVRRGESQNPLGTRSSLSRGPPQGSVPGTANNRSLLDILGLGPRGMDSIIPGAPLMAQSLGGAAVIDFGMPQRRSIVTFPVALMSCIFILGGRVRDEASSSIA